ncbi:MAG TPA: hypothetical protein VJ938_15160 [Acidimicrobiia bacterium]|nr:hypothetical protein [Acidimicrobiia bacterium]
MGNKTSGARILGVRTFGDEVLAALAPLGLAAAAGTALVVDLDPDGLAYPGQRSLAEAVAEGPRRTELRPEREGVAYLRNGGADVDAAVEMITVLGENWPAIVLRLAATEVPFPVVPVRPLWPGFLAPQGGRPAVWQAVPGGGSPPGPGPVLPAPGRFTIASLLGGRRPPRSRWIRAWIDVWGLPWR